MKLEIDATRLGRFLATWQEQFGSITNGSWTYINIVAPEVFPGSEFPAAAYSLAVRLNDDITAGYFVPIYVLRFPDREHLTAACQIHRSGVFNLSSGVIEFRYPEREVTNELY